MEFEKSEEEIKKIKKRFHLQSALEDLEKRQKIFHDAKHTIETMFTDIQHNYDVMTMTLPEDKKDFVKKEVKAVGVSKMSNFKVNSSQPSSKKISFFRTNSRLLADSMRRSRRSRLSATTSRTLTRPLSFWTPG